MVMVVFRGKVAAVTRRDRVEFVLEGFITEATYVFRGYRVTRISKPPFKDIEK